MYIYYLGNEFHFFIFEYVFHVTHDNVPTLVSTRLFRVSLIQQKINNQSIPKKKEFTKKPYYSQMCTNEYLR